MSKKRRLDVAFATPEVASATTNGPRGASTDGAPVSSPFWTTYVQALSAKLWSPTETDSLEAAWSSWSGSSNTTAQRSWFSTRWWAAGTTPASLVTTYSTSLLSSWLATTEGGPPQIANDGGHPPSSKRAKTTKKAATVEKPSAGKARRIRVYPNQRQEQLLQQWFGAARRTYNKCLELAKEDREKRTKKSLRAAVVHNDSPWVAANPWAADVPYDVRDAAMLDLLNAYASNFAKRKKSPNHQMFELRFREAKAPQQTITVRSRSYKKGAFFTSYFGTEPLRATEPLPDTIAYDSKLVRTRLGQYYFCIPMPLAVAGDSQARDREERIIALDPGVRTFQTGYDPSGRVVEFGRGDMGRIRRLCTHMDELQGRLAVVTRNRARWRMKRAWHRMQLRIRNLIDEAHKKIVRFLCLNYDVVLLPAFKTQQMMRKKDTPRTIGPKTARSMATWAHYRFKRRLLFKRQEHPSCHVAICDEAYTSKTCGSCGMVNQELGGAKQFVCPSCGYHVDRDINGARNILLKNSSLFGLAVVETLGLTPSRSHKGGECMVNGTGSKC